MPSLATGFSLPSRRPLTKTQQPTLQGIGYGETIQVESLHFHSSVVVGGVALGFRSRQGCCWFGKRERSSGTQAPSVNTTLRWANRCRMLMRMTAKFCEITLRVSRSQPYGDLSLDLGFWTGIASGKYRRILSYLFFLFFLFLRDNENICWQK